MSTFDLDIFNIETILIESNSMESLENSLRDTAELFTLSDDTVEMIRILLYKQYYKGRIDSNRSFVSGIKDFVTHTDLTEDHREVIREVIRLSECQLK